MKVWVVWTGTRDGDANLDGIYLSEASYDARVAEIVASGADAWGGDVETHN